MSRTCTWQIEGHLNPPRIKDIVPLRYFAGMFLDTMCIPWILLGYTGLVIRGSARNDKAFVTWYTEDPRTPVQVALPPFSKFTSKLFTQRPWKWGASQQLPGAAQPGSETELGRQAGTTSLCGCVGSSCVTGCPAQRRWKIMDLFFPVRNCLVMRLQELKVFSNTCFCLLLRKMGQWKRSLARWHRISWWPSPHGASTRKSERNSGNLLLTRAQSSKTSRSQLKRTSWACAVTLWSWHSN